MKAQGIYLTFSQRKNDLPEMIQAYNLSKADTIAEILRSYPKFIAYNHKAMEQESRSVGRIFLMP